MRDTSVQQIARALPYDVRQIAVTHKLGTLQRVYFATSAPLMRRITGLFCLLVGVLLTGLFAALSTTLFNGWPLWQSALVFSLGPLWMGAGIWLLLTSFLKPRASVLLYDQGLILVERKRKFIRWDEITKLWKEVHIEDKAPIYRSYTLQRADHTRLRFNDELQHIEQLGHIVEEQVTHYLLPHALYAYQAAQPVTFDALTLQTQGITVKEQLLPWQQVAHITIHDLAMSIYQHGEHQPWATLSSTTISNLCVLKPLIDYVRNVLAELPRPDVITLYAAGLSLTFGAITISQQGLTIQNSLHLNWNDIATITVGESEVFIRRSGVVADWYTLPLQMINDVATLRVLLTSIAEQSEKIIHLS